MTTNQILQKLAQCAFEDEMQKCALVGKGRLVKVLKKTIDPANMAQIWDKTSRKIRSGDIGFPNLDDWGGFGMNLKWSAKKELAKAPGKNMLQKLQQSKSYVGDVRKAILQAKDRRKPYVRDSRILDTITIPRYTGPGSERRALSRPTSALIAV